MGKDLFSPETYFHSIPVKQEGGDGTNHEREGVETFELNPAWPRTSTYHQVTLMDKGGGESTDGQRSRAKDKSRYHLLVRSIKGGKS